MRRILETILMNSNFKKILLVLSGILCLTYMLPYISIDLSDYDTYGIMDMLQIDTSFSGFSSLMILLEDGFFSDLDGIMDCFTDDMEGILYKLHVCLTLSYILLFVNTLLFLRKRWNKVCFAVLHTISYVLFQSFHLFIGQAESLVKSSINDGMGVFAEFLGGFTNSAVESIVQILKDSLAIGYWIFTIVGVLIFVILILSVEQVKNKILPECNIDPEGVDSVKVDSAGCVNVDNQQFVSFVDSQKQENIPQEVLSGMIRVLTGKYAGAEIPVCAGEYIVIGRNPKLCHLILDALIVSGVHCKIRFVPEEETFYVLDQSTNGTYQVNHVTGEKILLNKDREEKLSKGSIITLGKGGEQLLLV